MRGIKHDAIYEDGGFEASKTTTVTRMATPRGSIPVIVGTFEACGVGGGGGIPWAGSWRTENLEQIYKTFSELLTKYHPLA